MPWSERERRWMEVYPQLNEWNLPRFDNPATAAQYWIVYEYVTRMVESGARVLDWGCGDGHFSAFLLHQGYRAEGFNVVSADDYNPQGCPVPRTLESRYPETYRYRESDGDPVALPYEAETFDAVVSVGVLEHVRQHGGDEVKSLLEIRRILKPGGRFLCFHFPNRFSWIETLVRLFPSKHQHPYKFTHAGIRRLCRDSGLKLESLRSYAFLPRNELARLPAGMKNSAAFVKAYNAADTALAAVFRPFVQNHLFIARKMETPRE